MKFYGLFGYPLGHSISPAIHKKIYELAGIDAAYKKFEVKEADLAIAIEALRILNIAGANVTIPYKEKLIPLLDHISDRVQRLNSVNTIKNQNGRLEAYNTDYDGIALTFKIRDWTLDAKEVYVLGTGGASNSLTYYLKDQGAKSVTLVSRQPERYKGAWECIDYSTLASRQGHYLINCTPVGMYPKEGVSPVPKEVIANFDILFDMIYNPSQTQFLTYGLELGKEVANGLDMLVGQAMKSVEIWEDMQFDKQMVQEILEYFRENWEVSL